MANSVDPYQMLYSAASDPGLHCLQRPICLNTKGYYSNLYLEVYGSDWIMLNLIFP